MSGKPGDRFAQGARRFLLAEGSTRGLGLMRIAVVLMVWSRLADGFVLHRDQSGAHLLLSVAFYGGSLLMLVGWHSRTATVVTALCVNLVYHYLGPVHQMVSWTSHNIQLLVWTTTLLALAPVGRAYSVDRWLQQRRAARDGQPTPDEEGPLWAWHLLGVLVSTVYLATWLDKTQLVYLRGDRMAAIFGEHYTGSWMTDSDGATAAFAGVAWMVWLLEGLLIGGLLLPRLRMPLALAGALMHGSFSVMFRVFTFSANMVLLYLPFFPAADLHSRIDQLCPQGLDAGQRTEGASARRQVGRLLVMVAVLLALGAAAWDDLHNDIPVAQVQLLDGRFSTALGTHKTNRQARLSVEQREMQLWRDP
jgi:Vitamin K-dependent gamma-carboxylase